MTVRYQQRCRKPVLTFEWSERGGLSTPAGLAWWPKAHSTTVNSEKTFDVGAAAQVIDDLCSAATHGQVGGEDGLMVRRNGHIDNGYRKFGLCGAGRWIHDDYNDRLGRRVSRSVAVPLGHLEAFQARFCRWITQV